MGTAPSTQAKRDGLTVDQAHDIDARNFNADKYALDKICSLGVLDLLKLDARLVREMQQLDAQLQDVLNHTNWQLLVDNKAKLEREIANLEVGCAQLRLQARNISGVCDCS
jgi:hypothetical protein